MSNCLNILKKAKRLKVFESSYGILVFFLLSVCLLFSFFLLNYKAVVNGSIFTKNLGAISWWKVDGFGLKKTKKSDFLSEEEEEENGKCNLFDGDWVWDDSYPLYESKDCKFLDEGFRCSENGRPDFFFTKWRWQPRYCNLPRFDGKKMLEKLRNKRVVLVGDSIGRNQWESLLCMLSSVITKKESIYEVNNNPITKHTGFLIYKFKDYNLTLEYYKAPFLVLQSRPPKGLPSNIITTLKLDQMDWNCFKWRDADVLLFNTGHWWNYEKTIRTGCYFQEGSDIKMEMDADGAYKRSLQTVFDWIHHQVNTTKTQVIFRTYSPVHFRGGDWRTGGQCHLETLPELGHSLMPSNKNWTKYTILADFVSTLNMSSFTKDKIDLLNITDMSSRRKDGHSSVYYRNPSSGSISLHKQDCSHWCLPGVPDVWNELLYALFLKREAFSRDKTLDKVVIHG